PVESNVSAVLRKIRRRKQSRQEPRRRTAASSRRASSAEVAFHPRRTELLELVSDCLANGVTAPTFCDIDRLAFAGAAATSAKFRNGRINYSRVAAQTGLQRAEVRRLLLTDFNNRVVFDRSALNRVVLAWLTDPRYVDPNGYPVHLKFTGTKPSF